MSGTNRTFDSKLSSEHSVSLAGVVESTLGYCEWVMCVGQDKSFVDRMLKELKPQFEINCHCVSALKEGVSQFQSGNIDLILVDCKKVQDIEDAFETLANKNLNRMIPTCFQIEESMLTILQEKCSQLASLDYILKPYSDKDIIFRVSMLLARARAVRKLELGLGHISELVSTRDRVRSVSITLSYVLQALRPPGTGFDVMCWFFKGDTQWLDAVVQFTIIKPKSQPHTKRQLITDSHAMVRFKQLRPSDTPYGGASLVTVELKDGVLWLPVVREDYLRAIVSVSNVGIKPPLNEIETRMLNAFLGILSLSLEGIDIYAEVIGLEKKLGRTRLEELGNMAIKLGDRLNTPLN